MQFLNPLLLSGLALAAVPLIIHLLNRRRFRVVDWAPMKYLKLTLRTNRRRLRLEQWLLLLIRTLVVAVLILAVARPVLSQTRLGSLLAGRTRTARVVVIDDSLSMGYRDAGRTALERAKDAFDEYLDTVGSQDTLTVRLTSSAQPLSRDAQAQGRAQVLAAVRGLSVTHTASRWAATLQGVDEDLTAAAFPRREVVLVTDLRKSGWDGDVTKIAEKWAREDVTFRVIDVGSRATANVSVAALAQDDPVALPGTPTHLAAELRSDNASPVPPTQATLTLGDEARPAMLPELPPGEPVRLPLSARFDKPGSYGVRLALPGDALPEDDARYLALDVRDRLRVVLLDGEPGSAPFESETDFLSLAFTAGADAWQVERITDMQWLTVGSPAADVIVMANVASLSAEQADGLERLVRSGVGLMVFAGDQADIAAYNDRLYRGGAGVLPGLLEGVSEEPVTGLIVESLEGSPLDLLGRIAPTTLARITAKRSLAVQPPRPGADSARILARWNDRDVRVAAIEKPFGRGRAILWTVTADRQWSDWPIEPTYVLAMRAAAMSLARGGRGAGFTVGEPIRFAFPAGERPLEPRITIPNADAPQPLLVEASPTGEWSTRFADTSRAGLYRIDWKDPRGGAHSGVVAVNADPAESRLEPIDAPQLGSLLGGLKADVVRHGSQAAPGSTGREVWRTLAIAVLTMMALESLLAVWVGRER